MYVCMYVCVCVCMYVCMYVRGFRMLCVCVCFNSLYFGYICTHVHIHECRYAYMNACKMHKYMRTYITVTCPSQFDILTYTHGTFLHTHTCDILTYTHVCFHTHMYVFIARVLRITILSLCFSGQQYPLKPFQSSRTHVCVRAYVLYYIYLQ
jgi:hypothetical protein